VAAFLAMSWRVAADLNNVTEVYFSSGADVLGNGHYSCTADW
jgi:hypothetical protein